MGKTADLAMVQKTIIDTLHKEGKSQKVITHRGGYSQSAVSKHIKYKVDWKNLNYHKKSKLKLKKKKTSEMFYFTCNESRTYESFSFWNKLQKKKKKNFSTIFKFFEMHLYII